MPCVGQETRARLLRVASPCTPLLPPAAAAAAACRTEPAASTEMLSHCSCAPLQGLVLGALAQHDAPAAAAQALLRATFPAGLAEQGGEVTGLQPLAPREQEALTNALHAAAGQLLEDAQAAGAPLMSYTLAGRQAAAMPTLLDAAIWLADQRPAALEAALPAQLLEQVRAALGTSRATLQSRVGLAA